ncbi:MAG: LytTR family DNA-binding domain-containing protein [Symbiobacteriaceae bacterium]|nr:LytTR family DNA-binding domain-containing protein [Symbiobacteriaceae bacterium]
MQRMMVAVCEDDLSDAAILKQMVLASGIATDILLFSSPNELLQHFTAGSFQVLFLDLYYAGDAEGAARAAVQIREADPHIWIVFTTSSTDYATFGYKVQADRYLLKPLDREEVLSILHRASKHFAAIDHTIEVVVDRKSRSIYPREISYVEVRNKQCLIHLPEETLATYITIDELEKVLTLPSFLRCHRSYIVNFDYVVSAARDFTLVGGEVVYIAHTRQWAIRKAYRDYVARLARGSSLS